VSPSEQVYQSTAAPRVTGRPVSGPGASASGDGAGPGASSDSAGARPDAYRTAPSASMQSAPSSGTPRRVRLTLARIDPWSVLKLSFLLSVAMGIGLVTASVVLWIVINAMGVFDQLNTTFQGIDGKDSSFDIYSYVGLGRVMSLSTFVGVINIIIIMALSTLGAFLYNIAATLVGGVSVTLSDD
jgi:hypothetical protein